MLNLFRTELPSADKVAIKVGHEVQLCCGVIMMYDFLSVVSPSDNTRRWRTNVIFECLAKSRRTSFIPVSGNPEELCMFEFGLKLGWIKNDVTGGRLCYVQLGLFDVCAPRDLATVLCCFYATTQRRARSRRWLGHHAHTHTLGRHHLRRPARWLRATTHHSHRPMHQHRRRSLPAPPTTVSAKCAATTVRARSAPSQRSRSMVARCDTSRSNRRWPPPIQRDSLQLRAKPYSHSVWRLITLNCSGLSTTFS